MFYATYQRYTLTFSTLHTLQEKGSCWGNNKATPPNSNLELWCALNDQQYLFFIFVTFGLSFPALTRVKDDCFSCDNVDKVNTVSIHFNDVTVKQTYKKSMFPRALLLSSQSVLHNFSSTAMKRSQSAASLSQQPTLHPLLSAGEALLLFVHTHQICLI